MISERMWLQSGGRFRRDSRRRDTKRPILTAQELAGEPDHSPSVRSFSGHGGRKASGSLEQHNNIQSTPKVKQKLRPLGDDGRKMK